MMHFLSQLPSQLSAQFQHMRAATAFLCGAFFSMVLVSTLVALYLNAATQQQTERYGTALANMAAKQAVDATFNHDLVRLQVILRDTVENPTALFASIHDVEHNLLVQAGDGRAASDIAMDFTAPILLHDSIAGYVTLTLDKRNPIVKQVMMLLFLISLCLMGLLVNIGYRKGFMRSQTTTARDTNNRPYTDLDEESVMLETEAPATIEPQYVYTVIYIKNLSLLKQQLNSSLHRSTVKHFERILKDVVSLYGGEEITQHDNRYILSFEVTQTHQEAIFRAICGGYLALELASIVNNIPLDLSGVVNLDEEACDNSAPSFAGLIISDAIASDASLKPRLSLMETGMEDRQQVVASFEEPFNALIESQRVQLATRIAQYA